MKWFRNGEKGFTLIELLVVVGILGALAAVVVPNVSRFSGRGVTEAQATELKAIQTAMDTAISDLGPITIVANGGPVTDFSIAGGTGVGADIDAAGNKLYPNYLRFPVTGGANITYSWDANGKVTQAGTWK